MVDVSQDGECSSKDSATQWLDCGIPCPIGEESRMSKVRVRARARVRVRIRVRAAYPAPSGRSRISKEDLAP